MRVYLARHVQGRINYIAILEPHKSGVGHLHVLVSRFLPQRADQPVFRSARAEGRSFTSSRLVYEMPPPIYRRYLSKEQELPPGVRHVTTSRGLTIWPEAHRKDTGGPPPEFIWQLAKVPMEIFHSRAVDARDEIYTEVDGAIELSFFVASGLLPFRRLRRDVLVASVCCP